MPVRHRGLFTNGISGFRYSAYDARKVRRQRLSSGETCPHMAILKQLYVQVIIAIVAAVLLGILSPATAVSMKPLGDAFISLLRMMLAPIIFCSVVLGLTHVADMRQLGRLALKSLVYFEVLTTIAMAIGFVSVNVFQPGVGLHATNLVLNENVAKIATTATNFTAVGFFLSIIPTSMVDAFARGEILQVLFISILTGAALSVGGASAESGLIRGINEAQDVLFRNLRLHHAAGAYRGIWRDGSGDRCFWSCHITVSHEARCAVLAHLGVLCPRCPRRRGGVHGPLDLQDFCASFVKSCCSCLARRRVRSCCLV